MAKIGRPSKHADGLGAKTRNELERYVTKPKNYCIYRDAPPRALCVGGVGFRSKRERENDRINVWWFPTREDARLVAKHLDQVSVVTRHELNELDLYRAICGE